MSKERDWLSDMRSHFTSTGRYRAEDVRRVLGDQSTTVSLPLRSPARAGTTIIHNGNESEGQQELQSESSPVTHLI